jgi:hypothetical protein
VIALVEDVYHLRHKIKEVADEESTDEAARDVDARELRRAEAAQKECPVFWDRIDRFFTYNILHQPCPDHPSVASYGDCNAARCQGCGLYSQFLRHYIVTATSIVPYEQAWQYAGEFMVQEAAVVIANICVQCIAEVYARMEESQGSMEKELQCLNETRLFIPTMVAVIGSYISSSACLVCFPGHY